MSVNLFKNVGLDNDDINSELQLYFSNKINNGIIKMKQSYPYFFLTNDNDEVVFFKINAYNTNTFNAFGDSLSGTGASTWATLLSSATGLTRDNQAISASVSNDMIGSNTLMNNMLTNTAYKYNSSIIYYNYNDYRSSTSKTLYSDTGIWEYCNSLIDIYASCSLPQSCIIPARNMQVTSGSWNATLAYNNTAYQTNNLNATIRYNFTNKRFIYISFHQILAKTQSMWDISVDGVLVSSHYNTTVLSVNSALGNNLYSSGVFIDLGTNKDFQLSIKYLGNTEYNWVNYCCAYNLDDIKNEGRHVLAWVGPKWNYNSTSGNANYSDAKETKYCINKQAIIDAVHTCQTYNLPVFFLDMATLGPTNGGMSGLMGNFGNLLSNNLLKYINTNKLIS